MGIILLIVTVALNGGILFGLMTFLKNREATALGNEAAATRKKIETVDEGLDNLLKYSHRYISKKALEDSVEKVAQLTRELEEQKAALEAIEVKLEKVQKEVETREDQQQEVKASNQADQEKLEELLGNYAEASTEAFSLEQKLAESLRNLDSMLEELTLTADQRALLESLSEALSEAGARLRDLLTEYEATNNRLKTLQQQHKDLEEEYTRLVEQQLGE